LIRFAFYGRVSTEDQQDPESSLGWQRGRATALIATRGGKVIVDYFDIGQSRSVPWQRRPQANDLLTALADPARGFDAVVVGEPQRAFYGNQFGLTYPVFDHYGVPLWVPEVGGPIDPNNEAHDLIMSVFGGMSKGERMRIKVRVRAAMAAQAQTEGRYLGGRPPYGYRLADAGPHPNPAKAADGKRLHRLELDPDTAPIVRRIVAEFIRGNGFMAIAEGLTRDGIPCPSAHDRARNTHRPGVAWGKSAVRVILTNPRYTGRQIWNKQRKAEVLIDVRDVGLGHTTKMKWNGRDEWVTSAGVVHPPLVSDEDFKKVQEILGVRAQTRGSADGIRKRRHPYQLRGRMRHKMCGRKMQGSWNNGKAHYRCTFPDEYGAANGIHHPRSVYVREELIVPKLDLWIARAFDPARLRDTVESLVSSQDREADRRRAEEVQAARRQVIDCDRKLAGYRAALDAGGDPVLVAQWIAETQKQKAAAQRRLDPVAVGGRMSRAEVEDMLAALRDVALVLGDADPDEKAELYRDLGLDLVYDGSARRVSASLNADHVVGVRVRGGTRTQLHDPQGPFRAFFDVDAA
jgi:DNA invertase Pin-like site-specific DNA recombinase